MAFASSCTIIFSPCLCAFVVSARQSQSQKPPQIGLNRLAMSPQEEAKSSRDSVLALYAAGPLPLCLRPGGAVPFARPAFMRSRSTLAGF
jgi:hypothetical protein